MPATPTVPDFSAMSCLDQCRALYNAYMQLMAGKDQVQLRHGDYWVTYSAKSAADKASLLKTYNALYDQCEQAKAALPHLSTNRAGRGPALRGYA
jgi:hypothetical protein